MTEPPTCALGPRASAVAGVELARGCCARQRNATVLRPWPPLCLPRVYAFGPASVEGAG